MEPLIAWKPVGGVDVASARYRAFIPCRRLRRAGWACGMYDPRAAAAYRLVVFQKAYSEDDLNLAGELKRRGVRTVFDLCDNHLYNPADDPVLAERARRLRRMLELVDAVTVSTPELKKVIPGREACVIDDAVEWPREGLALRLLARFARPGGPPGRPLRVVWYGNAGQENPPFGLIDLPRVLPALGELHGRLPVALTIISNSREAARRYAGGVPFPVRYYEWRRATFPYLFRRQDVCIIPVTPNPFTVCKTSNRVVLSLLHGVPVVADRIPSYEEFGDYVLFSDWARSLHAYATDEGLRRRHVRGGVEYLRSEYGSERVVRQWSSLFRELLG